METPETEICFTKFEVYLYFGGHAMGRVSLFGPTEASSDLLRLEMLQWKSSWNCTIWLSEYQSTSEHCYSSTALTVFSLVLTAYTN